MGVYLESVTLNGMPSFECVTVRSATVKSSYNEFGYNEYLNISNFCRDFLKLVGVSRLITNI